MAMAINENIIDGRKNKNCFSLKIIIFLSLICYVFYFSDYIQELSLHSIKKQTPNQLIANNINTKSTTTASPPPPPPPPTTTTTSVFEEEEEVETKEEDKTVFEEVVLEEQEAREEESEIVVNNEEEMPVEEEEEEVVPSTVVQNEDQEAKEEVKEKAQTEQTKQEPVVEEVIVDDDNNHNSNSNFICKKPGHTLVRINAQAKSSSTFLEHLVSKFMDGICEIMKQSHDDNNNISSSSYPYQYCKFEALNNKNVTEYTVYTHFTDYLNQSCNLTMVRWSFDQRYHPEDDKHAIPHTKVETLTKEEERKAKGYVKKLTCDNCYIFDSQCSTKKKKKKKKTNTSVVLRRNVDENDDAITIDENDNENWIVDCQPEDIRWNKPIFPTRRAIDWNNITDEKYITIFRDPREVTVSTIHFNTRKTRNKTTDIDYWDQQFYKCAKCIPQNIAYRYSWMTGPLSYNNGLHERVLPIYLLTNGAGYTLNVPNVHDNTITTTTKTTTTTTTTSSFMNNLKKKVVNTNNKNKNNGKSFTDNSDGVFEVISAIAEFFGINIPKHALHILASAINPYKNLNCKFANKHSFDVNTNKINEKCKKELQMAKNVNFTDTDMEMIWNLKNKPGGGISRLHYSGSVEDILQQKKKELYGYPYEIPIDFAEHLDKMTYYALPQNLRDLWNIGHFDKDY